MPNKIVVAGSILVDRIRAVDRYPSAGELVQIRALDRVAGGIRKAKEAGRKADGKSNTLVGEASFRRAMEQAFYGPLGELTVPPAHRNFATKRNLPTYPKKIPTLPGRLFFLKELAGPLIAEAN